MTKDEMLAEMQQEIAIQLAEIEDTLRRWNLPMDGVTLIARASSNEDMIVVLTNEDAPGLRRACALALVNQERQFANQGLARKGE